MIRYCVAPRSALVLTALVACAPPQYPSSAMHIGYTVIIDTSFSRAETDAVEEGALDWERATDNLKLDLVEAPCVSADRAICVTSQSGEGMRCKCGDDEACVGCWTLHDHHIGLDTTALSLADLKQVASHEIGHAMGLHHNKSGTVMAPRLGEQRPPTCVDVALLWKQYGLTGRCNVK